MKILYACISLGQSKHCEEKTQERIPDMRIRSCRAEALIFTPSLPSPPDRKFMRSYCTHQQMRMC